MHRMARHRPHRVVDAVAEGGKLAEVDRELTEIVTELLLESRQQFTVNHVLIGGDTGGRVLRYFPNQTVPITLVL